MGKWILLGVALVIVMGMALWMGVRDTSRTPGTHTPPRAGDEPALRGSRARSPTPLTLELIVRTPGGGAPPAGSLIGVVSPPSLRSDREGELGHSFSPDDFEGPLLRIENLRYRVWDLIVAVPGHVGVYKQFHLPVDSGSDVHRLVVQLEPWASFAVQVLSADGAAVAGARLRLEGAQVDADDRPVHLDDRAILRAQDGALSDRRGQVTLPALRPREPLVLTVEHADHPAARVELVAPQPGMQDEVTVTFARTSSIKGEVDLVAFDAPAEAIILTRFFTKGNGASFKGRVPIRPDGSFLLSNVEVGRHTIQITARGADFAATAMRDVLVRRGEIADTGLIAPDEGVPWRVTVHAEEPYPPGSRVRAHLSLFPPAEDAARDEATPPALLSYEFALPIGREHELRGLPRGRIAGSFFLVGQDGGSNHTHGGAKAGADDSGRTQPSVVVINRRPAPKPTARLRIVLESPEHVLPREFAWRLFYFDADGRFEYGTRKHFSAGMRKLSGVTYPREKPLSILAVAHGRVSSLHTLPELTPEGAEVLIDRWPEKAARVEVTVRDQHGKAVSDVTVHARMEEDTREQTAIEVGTGPEGRAAFDALPGRRLFLYVEEDQRRNRSAVLVRAGELKAGGTVQTRIDIERRP